MPQKVAIVTGASRGIGAATARLLGASGYAVGVNYYENEEAAQAVVGEITSNGGTAIAVKANVGLEHDVLELFRIVDRDLGPITALVNNAGINPGPADVKDLTVARIQAVFSVNVFGTILCSREAVQRMQQGEGGAIVNVSSEAGRYGGNRLADYAASKAAVNAFTLGLAREVAKFQIRVNAVSPGIIATDMHRDVSQQRVLDLERSLPMGRIGSPDEVADTIFWLLSERASYVSGAIVPVAGAR